MLKTVILRFRDIVAETIAEHTRLIAEAQEVWWGWWRKPNEPKRLEELAELKATLSRETIEIGLYDRFRSKFFRAVATDCLFSSSGDFMKTPDELKTPEYYRGAEVPAWFKLVDIEEIEETLFAREFAGVPLGDFTFFPVRLGKTGPYVEETEAISEVVNVRGSKLVHLSDLHFGADFGFPATDGPGMYSLMTILENDLNKHFSNDIGLLIISGDTTSRGDAGPLFIVAKPFLLELCSRIGLDPNQVIIIPGNHDISYKDFSLTYDHEAAFNDFLRSFYGRPRSAIELIRFRLASGRLIEVLPINSIKLRTKETSNYGWVEWQAYEQVLEKLPPMEREGLRIAVIHHHLVPTLREERLPDSEYPFASVSVTLNAASVIEGLQRHGFKLVLHGHHHTPALNRISRGRFDDGTLELCGYDDSLYVCAGGSTGVKGNRIDGDIRDNTYSILSLEQESLPLTVRQFNPSGNVRELYRATLPLH